jgi:hypothetical protein
MAWLRPLTAIGLTLSGLAVLGAMMSLPVPGVSSLVHAWSVAVANGARLLTRTLDVGLWVWDVLGTIGLAARAVTATPWICTALGVNCVLAVVGFCGLRRVLGPHEEMVSW